METLLTLRNDIDRNWTSIIVLSAVFGTALVILFGWIIHLTYQITTLKSRIKYGAASVAVDPLASKGYLPPALPRANPAFGGQQRYY